MAHTTLIGLFADIYAYGSLAFFRPKPIAVDRNRLNDPNRGKNRDGMLPCMETSGVFEAISDFLGSDFFSGIQCLPSLIVLRGVYIMA